MALSCLKRYQEEPDRSLSTGLIAALTIGIASLTRTIGLALLVGGVAYTMFEGGKREGLQLQKRLLKSGFLAAVASVPAILWFIRTWEVSGGTTPVAYLDEYGLKDYAAADSGITGLRDAFELLYHNLYIYTLTCSQIIFPYISWLPEKTPSCVSNISCAMRLSHLYEKKPNDTRILCGTVYLCVATLSCSISQILDPAYSNNLVLLSN